MNSPGPRGETRVAWHPSNGGASGRAMAAGVLTAFCCLLVGCEQSGGGDPKVTEAAYESLAAGKASFEAGEFAAARDALEAATTKGGLQPDFYCEAVYLLGRCEAQLGNFDKARAAADILDQGDPDPDRVRGLRDVILAAEARRPPAEEPSQP
jgi:tetratricopeptide (TPR) repeat protein